MASTNLLFIFGLFLAFTKFIVAAPPPAHLLTESFLECRERCNSLLEPVIRCISDEFSPDKVDETRRLYNTTRVCLQCKHVCRRREQIRECLREGVEIMKDFSNKSKTMVPSSVQLAERVADAFCEEERFLGLTDADMGCLKNSWEYCERNLNFVRNMDAVALCEFEDAGAANLYTMEYVCKKSADYFDCASRSASTCSPRLATTISTLKLSLKTSANCFDRREYRGLSDELSSDSSDDR
ncbi:uncharacterized protein LOC124154387 isoform X1 [Ischnura elegans]|uniref:uncharacterized protein LOC124154387 isoform X1 n=1 Tax=Ischnura elegans TaxID=197161 RepID=UPI001ED8A93D|nr:uncharacterized protein LOC124154387 isoform X1 [Ischnura elegans]